MTVLEHSKRDVVKSEEKKPLKPFIVAAIPAFNEERSIAKVVLEAQKYVDVVLVCDDGSTDCTGEIAKRMGADVIRHDRNLGYGAATKSLFDVAKELNADVLITLDGDGQHNPNQIPGLIEPILENKADIVLGSRFLDWVVEMGNEVPRFRGWGIRLISRLTGAASNHNFNDAQCGFRVYGRKALSGLSFVENGMGVSVEVLMEAEKNGLTIVEVPAEVKYKDVEQPSTQNSVSHAASVLMSIIRLVVEKRPLTFLGVPGLISLLAGMAFGVWMLRLFVEEERIVTNVALAAISFVFLGIFTMFTAVTLYAISRQAQKNSGNR